MTDRLLGLYFLLIMYFSAQVSMQEPWKILSFDLSSRNSYFMDEIFYGNMLACFFAMSAREILEILLYRDEATLVF